MDLSGLIFIALAIAWACYLIPMALRHTDDLARTRTVEHFSPRLRVFGGRSAAAADSTPTPAAFPTAHARASAPAPTSRVTMSGGAAARRAAARRRRVLYVLTGLLVLTAGAAGLGYAPWLSLAAPVALIVAFLVIARITVKRERAARTIEVIRPASMVEPRATRASSAAEPVETRTAPAARVSKAAPVAPADSSDVEDTAGLDRSAVEAVEALHEDALPDDGSLWDPVPVTLPTYVTKPQARRTVRTIELTQSSGHDAADSKLARDAEAARAANAPKPAETTEAAEAEKRRAAGA